MLLINSGADMNQTNHKGQTPDALSTKKMVRLLGLESKKGSVL